MEDLEFDDIPVIRLPKKSMKEEDVPDKLSGKKAMRFVVKGGGERCEFILRDFSRQDVAKLRRIVMSSLETMSIELVDVLQNDTDFLDETILQRLGLLSIRCTGVEDIPQILNTERIEDEEETGIPFSIDVKNETGSKKTITGKDVNILDKRCHTVKSNTPIFYLRSG